MTERGWGVAPWGRWGLALGLLAACGGTTDPAGPGAADGGARADSAAPGLDVALGDSAAPAPDGAPPPTRPTYWRDVAPLLNTRCTECHMAGGLAPFPLDSYAEARDHGPLIVRETAARRMPPWPPARDCIEIQHARTLTDGQLELLRRWQEQGAAEGDRATYVPPTTGPAMLPATADYVLRPTAPYTPTARLDDYHCFVIDPGFTANRDLIGARIRPGEPRTVHHVILYEVKAAGLAELQRLDDREPGPGYTCFGGPGVSGYQNQQFVTGWAPGSPPVRFPSGTGIRLSPGSRLVMQVHYNQLNGRGLPDQTAMDLYFSPTPVRRVAQLVPALQTNLRIPAGSANAEATAEFNLRRLGVPLSVTVYGSFPHMHMLGRQLQVESTAMDGMRTCLMNTPDWNFHWQQFYFYEEPVRITPDDTIRIRCRYDNSAANQPVVDGVQQTPREVRWGEGSLDEMCLNFFYVTIP